MNIAIDVRSTVKRKTGIGYYTMNLINHLAGIDRINHYYLYSEVPFLNKNKKPPVLPASNFKHRINRFRLNPGAMLANINIWHTQSYDLPAPKNSKMVLVVHDVMHKAYPVGQDQDSLKKIEANMARALNEAEKVIVSSLATSNDLARYYNVDKGKLRLIYPGVNMDLFSIEPLDKDDKEDFMKKNNITCPYILYVGTLEPRKNIEGLIMAYKILRDVYQLEYKLVIVGMRGWGYDPIFSLVEEYNLSKNIIFTNYVSREQLKTLYQLADIFVYPSFYEGVGLPVLEAFGFGLPVVTSLTSSLGEISGDAAMLINPNKPLEIAQGIVKIAQDQELADSLRQKAKIRAKEFSWAKAAQKTLDVFNECL